MWARPDDYLPPSANKLSLSGVLNKTFEIYRKYFLSFILLIAIVQIPLVPVSLAITNWQQHEAQAFVRNNPDFMALASPSANLTPAEMDQVLKQTMGFLNSLLGPLVVELAFGALSVLIGLLLITAPLSFIASEHYDGRQATLGQAFGVVRARARSLLGGVGIFALIMLAITLVLVPLLFLCGLGFGLLAFVYIGAGLFLVPTLVNENLNSVGGLRRAWQLGKKRLWPLIGVTLGIGVLQFGILLFLSDIFAPVTTTTTDQSFTSQLFIVAAINLVVSILLGPILPIAYTLLYRDARVRAEATPPTSTRLLANEDIINLAIVCFGTLVLVLLYYVVYASSGGLTF